jgi:ABC-type multidrug transport system fused ATPase/permease subunit
MKDGGIEASGTHDELLKNSRVYCDINTSQSGLEVEYG